MNHGINLALIPEDKYSDYRYEVIFKAYKWDPQVEDQNTVSHYVALINRETAEQLETWAEQLSQETISMEEKIVKNIADNINNSLIKELNLPKEIYKSLKLMRDYDRKQNVRLMRFDFHPVTDSASETGWAVSEVNSDVPGGLAESSVLPEIAGKYLDGLKLNCRPGINTANILHEAFRDKTKKDGTVAFVHATSYADDRQVMQFLSDYFNNHGINTVFAAPDHIKWINKKAVSIIEGQTGDIDGIIRFFPLEWLAYLPKKSTMKGYFDCETISCNHPVSIFAQSKRLPLIWDKLGIEVPVWRKLLPETADPKSIKNQNIKSNWIYKPVLGRVGEGISIKGAIPDKDFQKIEKEANKYPKFWVAQQMFKSQPLPVKDADSSQSYHLCVGVFTIDGKRAGFYGRISPYPLIDSKARDIPILISD